MKDDEHMNKLKNFIHKEVDNYLKNSRNSADKLITYLESHILFLEDELRKKDKLVEKLVENNLNLVNTCFDKNITQSTYNMVDMTKTDCMRINETTECPKKLETRKIIVF
jgi:hypothetical protein